MAGLWGNVKDLFGPVKEAIRPKPAPVDPLAFLGGMGMGAPSSADLYADAMAQVGGAFNAQLENLAAQERQTKGRAKKGDAQLNAMYSALARDIDKNQGEINSMYSGASKANVQGRNATKSAISKTYSDTNNELGSLFARLGIEAAAPDALAGSNSDRNFLSGLVDFSSNSAANALNLNKAAASDFNNAQENIAGLTGKNRRADLLQQLNDQLLGIGQQRNQVHGQLADAVSQRQYQLEQDAMSREMQLQDMMMKMYGGPGGAGGPSSADMRAQNAQEYQQMGPNERARYKAAQVFGDQNAAYAMELLTGVANYQNGGVYQNLPHFIRSVVAENRKQQQAGRPALSDEDLADLASYFWDQGGTGKRLPQDPNAMF